MGQQFKPFLMQMQGTIQNPPPGMFKWQIKNHFNPIWSSHLYLIKFSQLNTKLSLKTDVKIILLKLKKKMNRKF